MCWLPSFLPGSRGTCGVSDLIASLFVIDLEESFDRLKLLRNDHPCGRIS